MNAFMSQVYQSVQADSDVMHALPEESIIVTEDDYIGKANTGEIPLLKGIYTCEEFKQTV